MLLHCTVSIVKSMDLLLHSDDKIKHRRKVESANFEQDKVYSQYHSTIPCFNTQYQFEMHGLIVIFR